MGEGSNGVVEWRSGGVMAKGESAAVRWFPALQHSNTPILRLWFLLISQYDFNMATAFEDGPGRTARLGREAAERRGRLGQGFFDN